MDLSSSLRRKQSTVTYAKRNRTPGGSAHSSPAVARRSSFAAKEDSSSSASSDDEAGPSVSRSRRKDATVVSPSSQTAARNHVSPKEVAARPLGNDNASPTSNGSPKRITASTPAAVASTSRSALRSASSNNPSPFPRSGSSSAGLISTTRSLPQRPPRAASPTPVPSSRSSAKRSASTSPRKLSSSVSPTKRLARSRTPSRPAQDLSGLFDAIEPTLPQPRNLFARSGSQPIVHLHHQEDAQHSLASAPAFAPSPLQSPTLPAFDFNDADAPLSPSTLTSPSKRSRMADRMAPRAARPTKSRVDEIAEALNSSRRGSLRRTETAPSTVSGPFASDTSRQTTLNGKEDEAKGAHLSDAGSARFDTASQADSQSQEGVNSALGARRLAGIKQSAASNAKRTYGLQRSFLADQAEDSLLSDPAAAASPQSGPSSRSNIEDEIEAELKGNNSNGYGTAALKPSETAFQASIRRPDSAPSAPRESYADLLKKWGEGADDIEWDESQDPTLNLKSITSLRSQGELRRFNDDLEYLFTGLEASQALSIRRSSTVELIRLLCGKPDLGGLDPEASDAQDDVEDPLASAQSAEFMRKLKASDLIARLFDLFRGAEAGEGVDDVLDAAMAVYIAKLLKSGSTAVPLIRERWSELHLVLRGLLRRADRTERQERKDGLALLRLHELKLHKIASRADRKTLAELRDIARISKLFVAGAKSWTMRNLVLASCCSLIVLPHRLWTEAAISDLFIDADGTHDPSQASLFNTVLGALVSEGAKAQRRLTDFTKGLELVTPSAIESIPDLETVDVCIRFLDKGMDVLYLELDQAVPASSETLGSLQHLISFAIQAASLGDGLHSGDADKSKDNGAPNRALQILHGLFKMLLDLSQVDANWSESLASSRALQEAIMRAFLLSHRSASLLRQPASEANGAKGRKGKSVVKENDGEDATHRPGVALFEDVVHLSLALLTNLLIKQLDKARDCLQSVHLNPTCWGRRACSIECRCDDRSSALQLLARVFFETRIAAASNDDSNAAYLSNSIATAIAQFAIGGTERLEECRAALDAELPVLDSKGSAPNVIKDSGFETLLDAVEEFAVVHEAALHAERARAAEAELSDDVDADLQAEDGDETAKATKEVDVAGDTSNPVAVEAGQLIKDLAIALRQMA